MMGSDVQMEPYMIFQSDVGKIAPVRCPICGRILIYEESDRRRWHCQCGRYERIEMNEREPDDID